MTDAIVIALWLGLAVLVGAVASRKGLSGLFWFALSLFLSPVLTAPFVLLIKSRTDGARLVDCHYCSRKRRVDSPVCPHCQAGPTRTLSAQAAGRTYG
jgi:hypothetical protein